MDSHHLGRSTRLFRPYFTGAPGAQLAFRDVHNAHAPILANELYNGPSAGKLDIVRVRANRENVNIHGVEYTFFRPTFQLIRSGLPGRGTMTFMGKFPIFLNIKRFPVTYENPIWQTKLR